MVLRGLSSLDLKLLSTREQVFDGLLLSPMKHPSEPNGSSSDEELLVAPPFTTIGLSIPSISWLNKQLESDGDSRPDMRGEKQDSQREQHQDTRDALSQASSRSEALFCTASRGYKLQTARTLAPRKRPSRMAACSRGIPYIDFTAEAPKLKRQLEHARSRQQALNRAGQRSSEEYTALSRETEGLLALVTPSRSLGQPKRRRRLKR
ncbi:hypothetical protein BJX99DRAFT_252455 [Aspergillus californicus]